MENRYSKSRRERVGQMSGKKKKRKSEKKGRIEKLSRTLFT